MNRLDKLITEQKALYTRWTCEKDLTKKNILLQRFLLSSIEFDLELMRQEKGGETTK